MSNRRISIHDYPEHLNPFNEFYNDGADTGHKTKYYTWSTAGRHKIKHAILDKPWSAMSPSKLGRRLSFLKTITIDKLSHSKNKQKVLAVESSNPPSRHSIQDEPFVIISPKQREKMRQLAQSQSNTTQENVASISNGTPSLTSSPQVSTLPVRRKLSLQENGTQFDDSSLLNGHDDSQIMSSPENEQSFAGARPKPRKKRLAPPPPPQQNSVNISTDMEVILAVLEECLTRVEDMTSMKEINSSDTQGDILAADQETSLTTVEKTKAMMGINASESQDDVLAVDQETSFETVDDTMAMMEINASMSQVNILAVDQETNFTTVDDTASMLEINASKSQDDILTVRPETRLTTVENVTAMKKNCELESQVILEMAIGYHNCTEYEYALSTIVSTNPAQEIEVYEIQSKESNTSSLEEGERSVSPDDSITHFLEQDAVVHSDTEQAVTPTKEIQDTTEQKT